MVRADTNQGWGKFWQNEYHPVELGYQEIARQKLSYLHRNPVVAGIVEKEEDYLLSSAGDYMIGRRGLLEIKLME